MGVRFHKQGSLIDLETFAFGTANRLLSLRKSHTRQEYPRFLVRDLITSVLPLQLTWHDMVQCFFEGDPRRNIVTAHEEVYTSIYNPSRAWTASHFDKLGPINTAGLNSAGLMTLAAQAGEGDNAAVEDIEFTVVTYTALVPLVTAWAALGLAGRTAVNAYLELAELIYCDDSRNRSLEEIFHQAYDDIIPCFAASAIARIGGTDMLPGTYRPLPRLW